MNQSICQSIKPRSNLKILRGPSDPLKGQKKYPTYNIRHDNAIKRSNPLELEVVVFLQYYVELRRVLVLEKY